MCVIEETKECPCDSESQVYIIDYFGKIVNLFSYNFDRNVLPWKCEISKCNDNFMHDKDYNNQTFISFT